MGWKVKKLEHLTRPVVRNLDLVLIMLGVIERFPSRSYLQRGGTQTIQRARRHVGGACESVVRDPFIPRCNVPTTVVSRSSPHSDS